MLAIGDIAINRSNINYSIKNLEFIVEERHIPFLKLAFNNPSLLIKDSNEITKKYSLKNNKTLIIHNANKFEPFLELLELNLANNVNIKICSPLVEFVLLSKYLKFVHLDMNLWETRITRYNELYEEYYYNYNRDNSKFHKLDMLSFTYCFTKDNMLCSREIKHEEFKYYTAKELYEIYSRNGNSQYFKLLTNESVPNGYLKASIWALMNHNEKQQAIIEYIYVNTVNNTLIENLNNCNYLIKDEEKLLKCYKLTIMNSIAKYTNMFFADYIMRNYFNLLEAFDIGKLLQPLESIQQEQSLNHMAMC